MNTARQRNCLAPLLDEGSSKLAQDGIDLCRNGDYDSGYATLDFVNSCPDVDDNLPAEFFSYLGLGRAGVAGRFEEAVELCERAIEAAPGEAEVYVNLARVYSWRGSRELALATIAKGLGASTSSYELLALRRQLGVRRKPVVPFVSRDHRLNRLLGRWRHRMLGLLGTVLQR